MKEFLTQYSENNWTFIPLVRGKKTPAGGWKEFIEHKPSEAQVTEHINRIMEEELNVGVITGKASGLLVVDFDYQHGGRLTLNDILEKGIIQPGTQYCDTPHGRHYYFMYPDDVDLRNQTNVLPGMDVRGEGGYVVTSPSRLLDDDGTVEGTYTWGDNGDIILPNNRLIELLSKPTVEVTESGTKDYTSVLHAGVKEGGRNNTAAGLAGHFFGLGLPYGDVMEILTMWNKKNKPPLSQAEIERTVDSIEAKEAPKRPSGLDKKNVLLEDFPIPEIPILSEYVRLAGESVPSPKSYHVLSCLSLLSTLLCEFVHLDLKSGPLYPNLYTLLLADTTWTYKTTSMDWAVKLLKRTYPSAEIGSGGSPEGLFYALSERSGQSTLFYRDEVVGFFFEAGQKAYMAGMLDSLTKYYDCNSEQRVLSGNPQTTGSTVKTISIRDPRLSLLTGGTLTRFFDVISEDRIMDGFLPRFLFSIREGSIGNMRPLEIATPQFSRDKEKLHQNIMRLFCIGERSLTTEQSVLDYHHEYLRGLVTSEFSRYNGNDFGGLFNRLAINVLKVAIIIACLDGSKKIVLTRKHLDSAIALSHEWKQSADYLIQTIGKPQRERQYDKIVKFMREHNGRTSIPTLMNAFHLETKDITRIMNTLCDREVLTREGRSVRLI